MAEVNEYTQNLIASFREANQAIAKSMVAAEERNIKFAQSTFANAMEVLRNHAEATQALMRELEQQTKSQQEAFKHLVGGTGGHEPAESYMAFFRAPLAFYQQAFEVAETASRQGLETMQKALESFQQAAQQGQESLQQATRQEHATTR